MESYPGGKSGSGVYQAIINQIPPCDVYVEPFLGHGGVLRKLRPAAASIGIEVDADVATVWNGDRVPGMVLMRGCGIEWLECLAAVQRRDPAPTGTSRLPAAPPPATIPAAAWPTRTFIYCDPPYLRPTRRSAKRLYRHELTEADHRRILAAIKTLPCHVAISGYSSVLYARELKGWRCVTFPAQTRGATAVEHLWCNYPEPAELHDYRYLGRDFRERERIKKKARRWAANFRTMPRLERLAVFRELTAPAPGGPGQHARSVDA